MKPRKRIASISFAKRASVAAYNREARSVVEMARSKSLICPVMNWLTGATLLVECVHHCRGKNNEALRHDKRGWLLTTVMGNGWIHKHPSQAREQGFLCPKGKWGTPFKPNEPPMPGSVAELESKNFLCTKATEARFDL